MDDVFDDIQTLAKERAVVARLLVGIAEAPALMMVTTILRTVTDTSRTARGLDFPSCAARRIRAPDIEFTLLTIPELYRRLAALSNTAKNVPELHIGKRIHLTDQKPIDYRSPRPP